MICISACNVSILDFKSLFSYRKLWIVSLIRSGDVIEIRAFGFAGNNSISDFRFLNRSCCCSLFTQTLHLTTSHKTKHFSGRWYSVCCNGFSEGWVRNFGTQCVTKDSAVYETPLQNKLLEIAAIRLVKVMFYIDAPLLLYTM